MALAIRCLKSVIDSSQLKVENASVISIKV